ncbi:MAG: hypothetical protein EBS85_04770 [Micrococcales bacterium]|nr:hypothetical protein [Micrococcales bacterium]
MVYVLKLVTQMGTTTPDTTGNGALRVVAVIALGTTAITSMDMATILIAGMDTGITVTSTAITG